LGIIAVADEEASSSSLASAKSFLANTPGAKIVIAHRGSKSKRLHDKILSVPFQALIADQPGPKDPDEGK
jgi:hypothetical protein